MSLADKIRSDLTSALKNKEATRVSALRMLLSSLKNAEISKRAELSDEDTIAQVQKAIKVRREAIDGAEKAGRDDLRQKEEAELKALEIYLPAQLNEQELSQLVAAAIEEAGARGPGDMGKVMKVLMPRIAGKADGSVASRLVKDRLSG